MNASQWFALINNMEALVPWNALAAPVVSSVLSWFKHLLDIEGDKKYKWLFIRFTGEQVMLVLIVAAAAGVGVLLRQVMAAHSTLWIIPVQAALIWMFTQPWYLFIAKPLIRALNTEIDKRVQQRLTLGNTPVAAENTGTQSFGATQQ